MADRLHTLTRFRASVWIICLASAVFLTSCKPGGEFSTPTQAGLAFAKAVMTGDVTGIRQSAVGSEADFAAVKSLSDLLVALKRLEAAAVRNFGREGELSKNDGKDLFSEVQACDEKIAGDSATLVNRNDPNEVSLALRKDLGGWKVNLAATLNNDSDLAQLTKKGTAIVAALDATTKDIEAGKYKTAEAAKAAMHGAMEVAAKTAP